MSETIAKAIALANNPFWRLPLALWDFAMFMTGNVADALRFYHECCTEILELLNGA